MMQLLEGPATPAVSDAEARQLSETLAGLNDDALNMEIEAATALLDGPQGRLRLCIVTQTWRLTPWLGETGRYRLVEIGRNMKLVAAQAGEDAIDVSGMTVQSDPQGFYVASSRPLTSVDVTAGFGDQETVPANVRRAIIVLAEANALRSGEDGNMRSFSVDGAFTEGYNSPEMAMKSALLVVDALLRPFRRLVFA